MTQVEDLAAMEMRLYRLEMKLLGGGDGTVNNKKESPQRSSSSPVKFSLDHTTTSGEDNMAILDTQPQTAASKEQQQQQRQDFASRLTSLEQQVASLSKSSVHRDALETHWKEIQQYLQDLDPGAALTHQQSIASPFLFRRQEVLASAEELKQNMQHVTDILNLLWIGQTMPSSSSSSSAKSEWKITEMHVTKAPILVTAPALSREQQQALKHVQETLHSLSHRVTNMSAQLDRLILGFQKVVTITSEKMVLMDEELRLKQQ